MVTAALVVANLLVFLFELSLGADVDGFIRRWGLVPADIGEAPGAWITLLTSLFLHAGWLHLGSNLLYLAVFGPPVERRLGGARFAIVFLASGVMGNVVHVLVQPTSTVPAIGASGAISGLIAAHLVLFPGATLGTLAPVLFLRVVESTPVLFLLLVWLAAQLFLGVASLTSNTSVAWWAHVGGFLTGLASASLLKGRRRLRN
jgi:membrane associated rhomboid family serine protease